MTRGRVLLVDDDAFFCELVRESLALEEIEVDTVHTVGVARERVAVARFDAMVVDHRLPDGTGLDLVTGIAAAERPPILLASATVGLSDALAALGTSVRGYFVKPIELDELRNALLQVLGEGLRSRRESAREATSELHPSQVTLHTRSPKFREAITLAERAAHSASPLLLVGETGTGKTTLARHVHRLGGAARPMVEINCAAIPESLLESELFGTDAGAFTGARAKPGLFELADGGTLFLDEIAELPLALQPKLLSAIEDGSIRRVGGVRPRKVRVRVIAATHVDLDEAVRKGRFRADLRYRLDVVRIHVPALRERKEDLAELASAILASLEPSGRTTLGSAEHDRLALYSWPGNLRELRNVLEREVLFERAGALQPSRWLTPVSVSAATETEFVPEPLESVERRHILRTVSHFGGHRESAARSLGVGLATLRRKLRQYGH